MFESTYYAKLDPSYREALLKLENSIKNKDPLSSNFNDPEINKFLSNYLMPRNLWKLLWNNGRFDCSIKLFYNPSIHHFSYFDYGNSHLNSYILPKRKLMDKKVSHPEGCIKVPVDITDMCYPHNLLQFYLTCYESDADSHLPKKFIQLNFEMQKLYDKIKSVEDNEEAWINAMKEVDDIEFVKHNIEYKLGQDLTNKKLWILYIKYLKEYDIPELLHTYSKYCRFFVDDIAMKEEYKNAAKAYGKVTVPWKNAYDFEKYEKHFFKFKYPKLEHPPYQKRLQKRILLDYYFNSKTAVSQTFPFRPSFMDYIVKNAKANELQKLNFCCKYFFSKYRIPVCYNLFVYHSGPTWNLFDFQQESLYMHSNSLKEININNFYVSTKFSHHHSQPMRNLIPKVHRCDAKFIDISCQELTINEFKFFIGHGNVVDLTMSRITVYGMDGKALFLEDILSLTPKLQFLLIYGAYCSSNTAQKLCEIPFVNKFMTFNLRHGTNFILDSIAFGEFFKKNASPHCKCIINYSSDLDREAFEVFTTTVNLAIDNYWPKDPKPSFNTYGY